MSDYSEVICEDMFKKKDEVDKFIFKRKLSECKNLSNEEQIDVNQSKNVSDIQALLRFFKFIEKKYNEYVVIVLPVDFEFDANLRFYIDENSQIVGPPIFLDSKSNDESSQDLLSQFIINNPKNPTNLRTQKIRKLECKTTSNESINELSIAKNDSKSFENIQKLANKLNKIKCTLKLDKIENNVFLPCPNVDRKKRNSKSKFFKLKNFETLNSIDYTIKWEWLQQNYSITLFGEGHKVADATKTKNRALRWLETVHYYSRLFTKFINSVQNATIFISKSDSITLKNSDPKYKRFLSKFVHQRIGIAKFSSLDDALNFSSTLSITKDVLSGRIIEEQLIRRIAEEKSELYKVYEINFLKNSRI